MPPRGVLNVSVVGSGIDSNDELAVGHAARNTKDAHSDVASAAVVGGNLATLGDLGDHGGGNDGLTLGENGVPLQVTGPAVIILPVSGQTNAVVVLFNVVVTTG